MEHPIVPILAFALDAAIGDPLWLPHPIRLLGKAIEYGEIRLRQPTSPLRSDFWRGATLVVVVVLGTYLLTAFLLYVLMRWSWWLGTVVTILLGSLCLAHRNLKEHAQAVWQPLTNGDLVS